MQLVRSVTGGNVTRECSCEPLCTVGVDCLYMCIVLYFVFSVILVLSNESHNRVSENETEWARMNREDLYVEKSP